MKTIKDFNLKGKKVLIRVDFNVPIKGDVITDDTRIKMSLETINYAINNEAKVILLSHLGRVKNASDKKSLLPISKRLSELLNKKIIFIPYTRGKELEEAINNLKNGDVLLMENTRFEDLDNKKESNNDEELGKYWASLGDLFINDAFATSHRMHASNYGIASNIESGIGFLISKELDTLLPCIDNPKKPFVVLLGGAKVKDKIGVIKSLVKKADYILIGGGMAFTFLKASGLEIGSSLLDDESIDFCKEMLDKYKDKIILPIDTVTDYKECFITDITKNEKGLDIGIKTVNLFKQYLSNSKTIIWNGPLGNVEEEKYQKGTKMICEVLKDIDGLKIAGGGDTVSFIKQSGYTQYFTYLSTGGGATLELLEGKELPSIEIIK